MTAEKIGWYKLQAFAVVPGESVGGNAILFAAHIDNMVDMVVDSIAIIVGRYFRSTISVDSVGTGCISVAGNG